MDEQQQQRVNEAARQFADALAASYRTVSDRAAAAQEPGAQLTQEFFNAVINNLRAQEEGTQEMTQQLAGQQQRAQEAAQELTQVSVDAYMDFLDSIFAWHQASVAAAERGTRGT